jgi:branched-chain amino acid transport system ATP-binding protein
MSPAERNELMQLAAGLARSSEIAVLFTEHDMDVVFRHADRVIVLSEGTLIAQGSPAEVRADPQVRRVYLGEESGNA